MDRYRFAKRSVLMVTLGTICFVFGYLYVGQRLSGMFHHAPAPLQAASPPAPVAKALEDLRARIKRNPNDEQAYCELGNLYFEANKFDQALPLYQKAVRLDGRDIVARNDLALSYHIAKHDKEALQQLAVALKISPNAQHLWLTLGLIHLESGRNKQAREALKRAYGLAPTSEAGHAAKEMLASMKS